MLLTWRAAPKSIVHQSSGPPAVRANVVLEPSMARSAEPISDIGVPFGFVSEVKVVVVGGVLDSWAVPVNGCVGRAVPSALRKQSAGGWASLAIWQTGVPEESIPRLSAQNRACRFCECGIRNVPACQVSGFAEPESPMNARSPDPAVVNVA